MKRDAEYRIGYLAGWLHAAGTGNPVPPLTPRLDAGQSYYATGFEDGARRGRETLCVADTAT